MQVKCYFLLLIVWVALPINAQSSRTIFRSTNVKENEPTGTPVADVSDFVDGDMLSIPTKNLQLLSQTLLTSKNGNTPIQRRRWPFKLDENSGMVLLARSIDRERVCFDSERCAVKLQIFAKPSQMIKLEVNILDVNEHPPVFPASFILLNVSEDARIGDTINLDSYMASDKDTGDKNSSISYSLNQSSHFSLTQYKDETGTSHLQIEVRRGLDFETKSYYRLTLFANDRGHPKPRSSHVPLQIRVTDENDNKPVFDQKEYSIAKEESLAVGQVVATVQAHDADSGWAGTVRYFLSGPNKHDTSALVAIDEVSGKIVLKKPLDRETFDELNIFIEARDLGKPQQIGRTRLVVYVSDVNDNAPTITLTYLEYSKGDTVYISESTPKENLFAYINAMDSDLGANGKVSLKIKSQIVADDNSRGMAIHSSDLFFLNGEGFIGVKKNLDAEKQDRYKITVNATDEGVKPRWSSKDINVVVLDANDHAPEFAYSIHNVSVFENTVVGTNLITMTATDKDSSNPEALQLSETEEIKASTNGKVTYSISGGEGTFAIEPRTGILSLVSPLDREKTSLYMITITATDGGKPKPLTAQTRLLIKIEDINDNAPLFTKPNRDGIKVYATILRDDVIIKVQAVDYDEGVNGKVIFKLLSEDGIGQTGYVNTSLFLLDSKTGDLRLNMSHSDLAKSLGQHVVVVQARDCSSSSPMTVERTLYVEVTDDEFLPQTEANGQQAGGIEGSLLYIIIAACVLTALLIIIAVIVFVILKSRRDKKKFSLKCSQPCRPSHGTNKLCSANMCTSTPKENSSKEGGIQQSSEKSWKQNSHDKRYNSLTSYSGTTDVTNLSRSDVMMTHQFLTQPRNTAPSTSTSLERKKPVPSTLALPTRSGTHDGDSGRGDSDPDAISGDTPFAKDYPRPRGLSEMTSSAKEAVYQANNLGKHCSEQCLRYGHSDSCWMPQDNCSNRARSPRPDVIAQKHRSIASHCDVSPLPPQSECSDQSSGLEGRSETKPVRVFWPQAYTGSTLTSIYSKLLPPIYVEPSAMRRDCNTEESHLLKDGAMRIGSSADSTTTGYVTEPEIV